MRSTTSTHHSWHLPNEAHGTTTVGAHPRKAGDEPGNSLPAAGVPTSMLHWSTTRHPQAEHRP